MIANVRAGTPHAVDEDELQAYVDGLLDAKRRSEVEAYLAVNPDEVERVEAYRFQNIGLHALFDRRTADEPVTAPIERLQHDLRTAAVRQRLVRRMAASLVVVLGAAAVGWWGLGLDGAPWSREPRVARQTTIEPENLRPLDPPQSVDAAPEMAQAGLVGWLSQRVAGGRPEWPDLRPFGLSLRGERMAATAHGLAVVLVYEGESAAGRRLAVHIDLNGDELPVVTPPPVREQEVALYWRSGPLILGLIGALESKELMRIAEAVTIQIAAVRPEPEAGVAGDDRLLSVQSEPSPPVQPITHDAGAGPKVQAPSTGVARQTGAEIVAPAAVEPITHAVGDNSDVAHDAGADALPEPPVLDNTKADGPPSRSPAKEGAGAAGEPESGGRAEPDPQKPFSGLPPPPSQHASRGAAVESPPLA